MLKKEAVQKNIILIDASGNWLKKNLNDIEQVVLPLGLMSIAAYLKQEFKNQVKLQIYNLAVDFDNYTQLENKIKEQNPDVVGIRGLTVYRQEFKDIADITKKNSKAIIIGGGPITSSSNDYCLKSTSIDVAVIGEGELTFAEIINKIIKNQPLDNIKGTVVIKNKRLKKNPSREFIHDLNSLPFPDYSLVNLKKYSKLVIP